MMPAARKEIMSEAEKDWRIAELEAILQPAEEEINAG